MSVKCVCVYILICNLFLKDKTIYCPMSGKPLKLRNFIEIKWTLVNDPSDKKSLAVRENRYMCAVTHDILSNAVPAAVIRTTYGLIT